MDFPVSETFYLVKSTLDNCKAFWDYLPRKEVARTVHWRKDLFQKNFFGRQRYIKILIKAVSIFNGIIENDTSPVPIQNKPAVAVGKTASSDLGNPYEDAKNPFFEN